MSEPSMTGKTPMTLESRNVHKNAIQNAFLRLDLLFWLITPEIKCKISNGMARVHNKSLKHKQFPYSTVNTNIYLFDNHISINCLNLKYHL